MIPVAPLFGDMIYLDTRYLSKLLTQPVSKCLHATPATTFLNISSLSCRSSLLLWALLSYYSCMLGKPSSSVASCWVTIRN